jgi:predicted naringenin-chalcone synthase
LSKIISIGTAVPPYKHEQDVIFDFMQRIYAVNETDKRKLRFLYKQSGIQARYSIIPDFSLPASQWEFFPATENLEPFPSLEKRMQLFHKHAATLSMQAIEKCCEDHKDRSITHLITVSCTGMSAPGLDLELIELMNLPATTSRTSVNFMGCYAAIHAMKQADAICRSDKTATVLIVCVECCTLHFQKDYTVDNITSSLLFGDGAAAMLMTGDEDTNGWQVGPFYSMVSFKGKKDMAWEMSSTGFQMTLSSFIPSLIEENFDEFVQSALIKAGLEKNDITDWCIHPGGKKILEAVHESLGFTNGQLINSYDVLRDYGNMSSPSVLFVLDKIKRDPQKKSNKVFGAAFGPGLTMETFILSA